MTPACPTNRKGITRCAAALVDAGRHYRTQFHIADQKPAAWTDGYPPARYTCPHGVEYWLWPTEQQARTWEAEQ